MAFDDPENRLAVPAGYATESQLKSMYEYAKALKEESTKPVSHWTQGVAHLLDALVGGYMTHQTGQRENLSRNFDNSGIPQRFTPQGFDSPITPGTVSSKTNGQKSDAGDGSAVPSKALSAAGSIESGGNYAALGPVTKTGDRAYGRYQVMGANIGPWSKEVLGRELTPQEFLKDQKAQDAIGQGKWNQYEGKHGPSGAARAWFAGEKGMNDPNRRDQLGTTVASYENRFNKAYGAAPNDAAAPSMAFSGEGSGDQPPAVQAIVQALAAKGGAKPPGQGATLPVPAQGQAGPYPSDLVPQRPNITREQIQRIMSSTHIPDAMKTTYYQQYMEQFRPQSMPWPGGQVIVGPGGSQMFVPEGHWGTKKLEGLEKPIFQTPTLGGGLRTAPTIPSGVDPAIPGRGGALTPPQGADPTGVAAGGAAVGQAEPQISPIQAMAAQPPIAAPQDKPIQMASLGGVPTSDTIPGQPGILGPLGTVPPGVQGDPTKLAAVKTPYDTPTSGIDAEDLADLKKMNDIKVDQKDRETTVENLSKFYTKRYDDLTIAANKARDELPQLGLAEKLMNDPNYYSGFLEGGVLNWQRAKAAVGSLLGDEKMKQAGGPMELVQKIISGSILEGMKSFLQGLGQVRVAEIQLLRLANASPVNTIASNQTLIKISQIAHQRMASMHDMAANYITGEAVVDPVTGKEFAPANVRNGEIVPRNRLDVGWDKVAKRYLNEVKFITPEEEADWTKLIKAGQAAKPPEASSAGGKGDNRIQVTGPEEAAKLAPGTKYMTPDGRKYTR